MITVTETYTMDKHYQFSFNGVKLDPYRILQVYGITHPAQQHALKKLLRAGRSIKPLAQDIDEVILSLNRWKEMLEEENIEQRLTAIPTREVRIIQPNSRGRRSVRPQPGLAGRPRPKRAAKAPTP